MHQDLAAMWADQIQINATQKVINDSFQEQINKLVKRLDSPDSWVVPVADERSK